MDLKTKIGNRITQSRKALGITIKELAARTGSLSAARISNWEQCTRSPGPAEAMLLAENLKVSASYLLCLTDNQQGEVLNSPRAIPFLSMKESTFAKELIKSEPEKSLLFDEKEQFVVIDTFNKSKSNSKLFAMLVEDTSMQPFFNVDDLVIIDADKKPGPGDYVLAHLCEKKQTVLRKYGEAEACLFQLLANNDLWATVNIKEVKDAEIIGVVVEHRRYF